MTTQKFRPLQTRRQRRIERRRQEIMEAAAQLFAAQGYAAATTREIADAADVSEGTLYNYFDGKREILQAIIAEMRAEVADLLEEAGPPQGKEDMIALMEQVLEMFFSHLEFTRTLLVEAWVNEEVLQEFVVERMGYARLLLHEFIVAQVATGVFRPVDPELTSKMILGMFFVPILPALRGVAPIPTPEERHTLAETAVRLLLEGIQAPAPDEPRRHSEDRA